MPSERAALSAVLLSLLCLLLPCASAMAQTFPSKPIRTIMTVGGGLEILGRMVAQGLTESLGRPVVLETQSGAGGAIGAEMVARAAPDGHTLALMGPQTMLVRKHLVKNVPYDPVSDFTPIGQVVETTAIIVSYTGLPANNLREVIEYARRNPGKLDYGTSGIGTSQHFSAESITQLTGIRWNHIPYKAGPPVLTDLMTGRIHVGFSIMATMVPFLNSDKIRIIAINSEKRYPSLPELPTVTEIIPGYERPPTWSAYFGPAGLPRDIVIRLNSELNRIMAIAAVREKSQGAGLLPSTGTPEELAAMVKRDYAGIGRMVKQLGLVAE
ncbi:MAG: Bug family tripartite tricarboxylate transporter substrate binding protein [Burkholderiales bacterium]